MPDDLPQGDELVAVTEERIRQRLAERDRINTDLRDLRRQLADLTGQRADGADFTPFEWRAILDALDTVRRTTGASPKLRVLTRARNKARYWLDKAEGAALDDAIAPLEAQFDGDED